MQTRSTSATTAAIVLLSAASMFGCRDETSAQSAQAEKTATNNSLVSTDPRERLNVAEFGPKICDFVELQWSRLDSSKRENRGPFDIASNIVTPEELQQNQTKLAELREKVNQGDKAAFAEVVQMLRSACVSEYAHLNSQLDIVEVMLRSEQAGTKPSEGAASLETWRTFLSERIDAAVESQGVFREFFDTYGYAAESKPIDLSTGQQKAAAAALIDLGVEAAGKLPDNTLVEFGRTLKTVRAEWQARDGAPREPNARDVSEAAALVALAHVAALSEADDTASERRLFIRSSESLNTERFTEAYLTNLDARSEAALLLEVESGQRYEKAKEYMVTLGMLSADRGAPQQ